MTTNWIQILMLINRAYMNGNLKIIKLLHAYS